MSNKPGLREQALRDLRSGRSVTPNIPSDVLRRIAASEPAGKAKPRATAPAQPEESSVTKKPKTKAKAKKPPKAKKAARAAKPAGEKRRAESKRKKGPQVSAQSVADFMLAAGADGVTMEALTKEFGIEAHPMRAKVYNVRHNLGVEVEHKDGRYFATATPKEAAQAAE